MTSRVAIGLGSNLGDRAAHLAAAVDEIAEQIGVIVATSSIYETAPVGGPPQGAYLNAVVVVDTALTPRGVLDRLLAIERARGRERRERWGPRTLDLDILVFGDTVVDEPGLSVPHPDLASRRFVLEPLAEIWPDLVVPGAGPVSTLRSAVTDQDVTPWQGSRSVSPRAASAVVFLTVALACVAIWYLFEAVLP